MTNSEVQKVPLDLELYAKFEIPQEYMAYQIIFYNLNQMQCDDLEYEYHTKGYKIFHTELERSSGDLFIYKLIIGKASMTFSK